MTTTANFADLLARAITEPGLISRAYTAFHGYSVGNQLLALEQCAARGIEPGPIARRSWAGKRKPARQEGRARDRALHAGDL
jgi:hypothetical protein